MNAFHLFVSCAVLSMCTSCKTTTNIQKSWVYNALLNGERSSISIDPTNGGIFIGDIGKDAHFCTLTDSENCFLSEIISLDVPKKTDIEKNPIWTRLGVAYVYEQSLRVPFRGRSILAHVVTAKGLSGLSVIYFLNTDYGLIRFGVLQGEHRVMYELDQRNEKGFDALQGTSLSFEKIN